MLIFNVVKEPYGWAIRMGERMSTPYRSRLSAIRDAQVLAEAIRRQGGRIEVVVEDDHLSGSLADAGAPTPYPWHAPGPQARIGF